jgi:uncharacterized membrane protein
MFKSKIKLKQDGLSSGIGGIKAILLQTTFYVSLLNFALITITAYNTTIAPYAAKYIPWLNMPVFLLALIVILVLAMVMEYKYIYPAMIKFQNEQEYEHQSLLRRDLADIKNDIDELKRLVTK